MKDVMEDGHILMSLWPSWDMLLAKNAHHILPKLKEINVKTIKNVNHLLRFNNLILWVEDGVILRKRK